MRIEEKDFLHSRHMLWQGKTIWEELVREYHITKNDLLIMLSVKHMDMNLLCYEYVNDIQIQYQADRIIFIGSFQAISPLQNHILMNCVFVELEEHKYRALSKVYRLYRFTDRMLFCDPGDVTDKNIFCLEGVNGISRQEIFLLGILGLNREKQRKVFSQCLKGKEVKIHNLLEEPLIEDRLKDLLEKGAISVSDKVIIFGVNHYVERIIKALDEHKVYAIIDNNKEKTGTLCCGVKVYQPNQLLSNQNEKDKIVIASSHYIEMSQQLQALGYEKNINYFIVETERNAYDVKMQTLDKEISFFEEGFKLYKSFQQKNIFFFLNQRATGNTYLLGVYLPGYVERERISEYIVLNVSLAAHKICGLFNIPSELISKHDAAVFWKFARVMDESRIGFRELCPYDYKTKLIEMRTHKGLTFNDIYKFVLYEDKTKNFLIERKTFCKKDKRQGGNKILISPYAKTVSNVPKEFWIALAALLKKNGYDVFTNCGLNENAITGTYEVFIPYEKLFASVDEYKFFIGVRSGLCDLLAPTNIKMVVLYPSKGEELEELFDYKYFSLVRMGLRTENIVEMSIAEDNREWNVKKILQWVVES